MSKAPRHIWLCADDYGISPGVSAGLHDLIARERINATSVMVVTSHFNSDEAAALETLNAGKKRAAIGLHVTLTAPFSPVSVDFRPVRKGRFLSLNDILRAAVARPVRPEKLVSEITAPLRTLICTFWPSSRFRGRPSARASVSANPRRVP